MGKMSPVSFPDTPLHTEGEGVAGGGGGGGGRGRTNKALKIKHAAEINSLCFD